MKNKIGILLCIFLIFICFVSCSNKEPRAKTFYTYFDTVISVYSYGNESQKKFDDTCNQIEKLLDRYNRLFDIYHEYSDVKNLCTVNKNAGSPVVVDHEIIELLLLSKEYYKKTNEELNVMMGAVLKKWHSTITESSAVPGHEELQQAANYCSFEELVIDEVNNIVMIKDSEASIDVGAIAKGFATEKIADFLEKNGLTSYAINAGGNVRLIGEKPKSKDWSVAIQNPFGSGYALILKLHDISCVTSGIYERYVEIDGVKYHHIIDKDSLAPASYFESVSIITNDSCYADALSTALFCMSYEEGASLQQQLGDFEVIWIMKDGAVKYSEGVKKYVYQE